MRWLRDAAVKVHGGISTAADELPRSTKIVLALMCTLFVVGFAVVQGQSSRIGEQTDRLDDQAHKIQEGRQLGSKVTCAFGSALAEAGRASISMGIAPITTERQRRYEAFLVAHGRPTFEQRVAAAKIAGKAYVTAIAQRVEKQTGAKGLVIRKGPRAGTLNCKAVAAATLRGAK